MKKPKDVTELASRLANAASTPLVPPAPVSAVPDYASEPRTARPRRSLNRGTVSVFLRLSPTLFEQYDNEAVRRTKETGRGVTVQQIILERLAEGQSA